MCERATANSILDLLGNEYVRQILRLTSTEPMTPYELEAECDASLPTIYRQIETLTEYGLLTPELGANGRAGECTRYRSTLGEVDIELDDGEFTLHRRQRPDMG
ncbi:ArsR/SmtB family transcription factor [Haloarcula nitratireducens]|uniref:Helix-turn-helix domain-containing protein n=1 Tax=Haloarcula nitratireducens TaxID=2487749 RepID=A0AAW4PBW6_9EURY|nr:helix-turn-helix domain-containing protein [Halomicroarcula nitratireducens]MBX0295380.1 helix-turn-helix domain-containing protein [Halomicroarcula nitratireducens]